MAKAETTEAEARTRPQYQAVSVKCPHLNEDFQEKSSVRSGSVSVEAIIRFADFGDAGIGLSADSIMCPQYDDKHQRCNAKPGKQDCDYRLWKGFVKE